MSFPQYTVGQIDSIYTLLPPMPMVYLFFGADGQLLYIGSTGNFGRRWSKHRSATRWLADVEFVVFDIHETLEDARQCEARAIARNNPPRNIRGKTAA